MPTDVWLQPESWADNKEMNEAEEHESCILSNNLFAVSPAKGCLQPGARLMVTLIYKLVSNNSIIVEYSIVWYNYRDRAIKKTS